MCVCECYNEIIKKYSHWHHLCPEFKAIKYAIAISHFGKSWSSIYFYPKMYEIIYDNAGK